MTESSEFAPWVEELHPPPDPEAAFLRFAGEPHCIFFDSALHMPGVGRYSFLAADPIEFLRYEEPNLAAFQDLERRLAELVAQTIPDLPPFQGGAAGLFSYDLNRALERVSEPRYREFPVPYAAFGIYDVVIAFDHDLRRAWLISQGFPEREPIARRERAEARAAHFRKLLAAPPRTPVREAGNTVPRERLAPQYALAGRDSLTSNFSAERYFEVIAAAQEYIRAGDVFQVNLAQRLLHRAECDAVTLYLRLRERNPATFAAYFDLGDYQIASASPERFVSVRERRVETRPIKGTRRRTFLPEADLFTGDELQASEKDRAENVMIVDLLRNDLARVCNDDIRVTKLCGLESYRFVQHLTSVVEGTLRSDQSALTLLQAAFPGGSITGAPKVRAMEIIAELEPTARGAYCGSLGYLGADGSVDFNILIRTITAGGGWWQMQAGGGITIQSQPQREYEETWHKAEGLLRAVSEHP